VLCRPDQDDFWLIQPETMNLNAFKVLEQLCGFYIEPMLL
jgi:hypothetical protein